MTRDPPRPKEPAPLLVRFLAACALASCGIALWGGPSTARASSSTEEPAQPNVLVIVTDDQRADTMSVMNRTLDIFGGNGVTFPEAYATTPLCCPSRASIFTGRFAHNHRVKTNEQAGLLDHGTTTQRYLHEAGYRTALVGKFLNKWPADQNPPHFDRWSFRVGKDYFSAVYNVDGTVVEVPGYSTDYEAERSVEILQGFEADDQRPWLMYVTPIAPHEPSEPAPEYADTAVEPWPVNPAAAEVDLSDKPPHMQAHSADPPRPRVPDDARRTLMSVDDMVGDVFQAMEELDEADDTLAFFISDNGYLWGEHGLTGKVLPYTDSIKVPFFVSWPGHFEAGAVDRRPTGNIDIAPTIMDAAGLTADMPLDGSSLLDQSRRASTLTEAWPQGAGDHAWASIRGPTYQYVEYYGSDKTIVAREYYDLESDPWQLQNLLGDVVVEGDPDVDGLQDQLKAGRECRGNGLAASCDEALNRISLDVEDVLVREDQEAAVFALSLSRPADVDVDVPFSTAAGSATATTDFASTSRVLTIPAGEVAGQVSVPVTPDALDEVDETFRIILAPSSGAILIDGSAEATVADDDPPPTVTVADTTVPERDDGLAVAPFPITLSEPSGRDVRIPYMTADGSAVSPGDYTSTSGTLTIPAGETTGQIAVPISGDALDEVAEAFSLQLMNPVGAELGDPSAVGTIVDGDPEPGLAITDEVREEGDADVVHAAFTLSLSSISGRDVAVDFATKDGSAVSPGDYTSTSGTLTIPAGQLTAQIPVPVSGDILDEGDESFGLEVTGSEGAVSLDRQATATILDDDPPAGVSISDATADEAAQTVTFEVALDAPTSFNVAVRYESTEGTALGGTDYAAETGVSTIPPGHTTTHIGVPIVDDGLDEAPESFTLRLTEVEGATLTDPIGTGSIVDDDPQPEISVVDAGLVEGDQTTGNLAFRVELSTISGREVTVGYETVQLSAVSGVDYVSSTGSVTIPPGAISGTLAIPIVGDTLDEPDERFTVRLKAAVGATISDAEAQGTILDDDPAPSLALSDIEVTEGDSGVTEAIFTVTLSQPSGMKVSFGYGTSPGTAALSQDFLRSSGRLSVPAGQDSGQIAVLVQGDTIAEADETFYLNLSQPASATIADGQGVGTIADDDTPPPPPPLPSVSVGDVLVPEGDQGSGPATFAVALSEPSPSAVTVEYATAAGSADPAADYQEGAGTLLIPAGETFETVDVQVLGDQLHELNETFSLTLTAPSGAQIADGQGTATIEDDDVQPTVSVEDAQVQEGTGSGSTATFRVTLSEVSGLDVVVGYATADGSAIGSQDYESRSGQAVVPAGRGGETISIPVIGDAIDEPDEAFGLLLTSAAGAVIADGDAAGLVLDDDSPPGLSVDDVMVTEGNAGNTPLAFTVRLSHPASTNVGFAFSTLNGTAVAGKDYKRTTGTSSIPAGQVAVTVNVTIVGDLVAEANEMFSLELTSPRGAPMTDGSGTAIILDDDP